MDEHSALENLRGSNHRSVIPYVYERAELYCSSLYESEPFLFSTYLSDPSEEVSTRSIYSSNPDSYNETRGPTGGLKVVETLCNIYDFNG
jgi:hypothetical protein